MNHVSDQQILNICEFLHHITNEDDLEKQYISEMEVLKSGYL